MSKNVTELTETTFDEVVNGSEEPVLVDFWAEWCGPCKAIAPVLEEIATEHQGKIKITKLNVDENQTIAQRFGVMSIPTLLVFNKGEVTNKIVGAKPKAQLEAELALS